MNGDVLKWVKRNNRKDARLISYKDGVYDLVYFDKGKVRIGTLKDGMYCRYGINCRGAMHSEDPMSLWQSSGGACSSNDVKIMQAYLSGGCTLPVFDFSQIKGLKW
ncbi:TPA: hypothetical protein L4V44_006059 [Pseudomonas aeruginosa]|uniref:hypothetical protein n=1 Tax=Pseudomonas phage PAJU2 TaxID=504346 RepID=UPI000181F39F|nr:hypothetical protein PAJU2_gp70 [Pseudomonas phage PAJU2]BAG75054.1 hypothetical protein [Pseudomonas phage PAJU2]HBO4896141.1 hypothetical protein [Pseudomonas aeruginosa]